LILGLGIDIIEIERIKHSVDKFKDHFLNKIYTQSELEYCLSKKNKYQHLAARFTAKEAVFKALSSGVQSKTGWKDIEIVNGHHGQPVVYLKGKIEKLIPSDQIIIISISHSRDFAACIAILSNRS